MTSKIASVNARQVWDSRGRPTVEVEIGLTTGHTGRAMAPAGASRGINEATDLRDGGTRFGGYGVDRALEGIRAEIAPLLNGMSIEDQSAIDAALIECDGTTDKSRLGGNAMIATSLACLWAAAADAGEPLWRYLAHGRDVALPLPEIQIFGGGAHAAARIDIQDFMVIANGASQFDEALAMTAEVYAAAGRLMDERGALSGVADEGGFWPNFESNEAALDMLVRAIESAGLRPGEDVSISVDVAASEFCADGIYRLAVDERALNTGEMIELLGRWIERYPIISVEDPLSETDEAGLIAFTERFGGKVQVIGDDYLVTNAERVRRAQQRGACNAVLVKPNQAGTVSETRAALQAAHDGGWDAVVSARSGETEDVSIVHLAVGWGAGQLKVGSFARSERMAKWNEGLRIADQLGGGQMAGSRRFGWLRG
ncbi:phosphopyruvate hydratase [Cucumibacter marinus]|uniref:phosphopyruvate hydratase n=1 Tax=Cucumibacter marinus TaxID=1121252 RepID=UPI000429D085|nr:phosphopyruvate hydratase [Cucumibacter marinus]